MDINQLRIQTASARASREAVEDAEFNDSLLRRYIDKLIKEAAKNGEYEISPNYCCIKERVLGSKYIGPSIEAVIRHYSREGFSVREEHWLSHDGDGNTSLIISWK